MAIPVQQSTELYNYTTFLISAGTAIGTVAVTKFLDFWSGSRSLKRDKLHENRIVEIKNFYKSYHLFKLGVEDYFSYTLSSVITDIEITKSQSNGLLPLLSEFQYQSMVIRLFLDETTYQDVLELEKVISKIKLDIDLFHIAYNSKSNNNYGERMLEIKDVDFKITLPNLMNNIELILRKTFV